MWPVSFDSVGDGYYQKSLFNLLPDSIGPRKVTAPMGQIKIQLFHILCFHNMIVYIIKM